MIVVEILSRCVGHPIRFMCLSSGDFPNGVWVFVRHDKTPLDAQRYFLQVTCTEANVNKVRGLGNGGDQSQG